ncbi:3-hydroxyacyl-ACP dehydratase FabZ family protein [Sediminicoccus sp. KRV36]|uniref:3-hydroxyacyl-ACP dehydratase FabZ family protein n=1 Tax=Sediminicoccus sp. KRV36 TaxID=3133721 RepID=UPI00200C74DE|nr:3-hydroxyacyl-ACP dehydratase FabZ family protein [Sediminicoccus rosea]UPY34982.1 beta-hydroxyacyl-ACP dehydratase [Sediminicoccus rosea]
MRLEYFEMIDQVLSHDDTHLTAQARVPETSPVFEGHFPGFPLLPGVLMIEAMAQACGWLMVTRSGFTRMALLAKVGEAKLRGMVKPGATLTVTAELIHDGSGYAVLRGTLAAIAAESTTRAAEAELTLRTMAFPAPELEAAVRARATVIGLA